MTRPRIALFWGFTGIATLCGAAFLWIIWFNSPFTSFLTRYVIALGTVASGALLFWMLRDCMGRQFARDTSKLNWVLIILLTVPVGTALYYLMVVRKDSSP